ncbi:UNVERIFIED_CONTAM: hypothetical protein Sangu_2696000 [Sesamum angustifolium]|uniref:Uncharacterized protein n=1 Tax=Sesamum angustifolium TaxID=2727405 RepID=A0AAW2IYS9_9LAMI
MITRGWGWDSERNTITDDAGRLEELYQTCAGPSGSGRRVRRGMSEMQAKKCDTMDRLNESLQGKIDRSGPKATESIERCVDELTKFSDLPDIVFTTALERFHSHSTRTIFLRLNDENKLRWLYSLGK